MDTEILQMKMEEMQKEIDLLTKRVAELELVKTLLLVVANSLASGHQEIAKDMTKNLLNYERKLIDI